MRYLFLLLALLILPAFGHSQSPRNGQTPRPNLDKPEVPEKRLALVIGNSAYKFARPLANPINDATDMSAALSELGFEVITGTDLSLSQMRSKVREFGDRLKANGGVGLFYFAGHGMQTNGRNYLLPVDADIAREDEIESSSFSLDSFFAKLESAKNGFNIVILDACRNHPFASDWSRGLERRGLAQTNAPVGTFIAYATDVNKTADDGLGRNGLYTAELLRIMNKPDRQIEQTFKDVQQAVRKASSGKQVPWLSSSFSGDFYFAPMVIARENLFFDEGTIDLSSRTLSILDSLLSDAKGYEKVYFAITKPYDSKPIDKNRVDAVRNYLIGQGFSRERIGEYAVEWLGKTGETKTLFQFRQIPPNSLQIKLQRALIVEPGDFQHILRAKPR